MVVRVVALLDPVSAKQDQTLTIIVIQKSRQLENVEKEANQLLHETGSDPTAGLPIVAERAVNSDWRSHHLIVRAWENGDV